MMVIGVSNGYWGNLHVHFVFIKDSIAGDKFQRRLPVDDGVGLLSAVITSTQHCHINTPLLF